MVSHTDPLACADPTRRCACRQSARYAPAGATICRRKGNRPDRVVDCEAAPSREQCSTCPLWCGVFGCGAGTKLVEDEDRRVHRPQRLGMIPT